MNFEETVKKLEDAEKALFEMEDKELDDIFGILSEDVKYCKGVMNEKLDSIHKVLNSFKAQRAVHEEYKKEHEKAMSVLKNKSKRLENWVLYVMKKFGVEELKGTESVVNLRSQRQFSVEDNIQISPMLAFKLNSRFKDLIKISYAIDRSKLMEFYDDEKTNEEVRIYGKRWIKEFTKFDIRKDYK